MKHEQDIFQELGRLPKSLKESYDNLYRRILDSGKFSRTMAERAMKWLLCGQRPLQTSELLAAICVDPNGRSQELSHTQLLDFCCNMIVLDTESNVFRFIHLSVREYLEGREEYTAFETNSLAAERCLDAVQLDDHHRQRSKMGLEYDNRFRAYAILYWPLHWQYIDNQDHANLIRESLRHEMRIFLYCQGSVAPSFRQWLLEVDYLSQTLDNQDSLRKKYDYFHDSPPLPITIACCLGLLSTSEDIIAMASLRLSPMKFSYTGLHLAVIFGHEAIVRMLLSKTAVTDLMTWRKETPLHLAVKHGHGTLVRLLLQERASPEVKDCDGYTALHVAASNERDTIVQLLIENGAHVKAQHFNEWTALHLAAMKGHADVTMTLLSAMDSSDIIMRDVRGRTARHHAAHYDKRDVVKCLLQMMKEGDIALKDREGKTALCYAEDMVVQKMLLKALGDPDREMLIAPRQLQAMELQAMEVLFGLTAGEQFARSCQESMIPQILEDTSWIYAV